MGQRRVRLRIRGRVQGVFYRDSTRREARRLGLRGWVRNRSDGSVEAPKSEPASARPNERSITVRRSRWFDVWDRVSASSWMGMMRSL